MSTLDLSGFHVSMKDLIGVAIDLGWRAKQETGGSRGARTVVLHSYDGQQSIRATPVRQMNEAKLATMRRKVVKYGEPMKRFEMVAKIEWAEMKGFGEPEAHFAPSSVEARASDHVEVPDATVTSVRPWLAKRVASKRGGIGYESQAVIEQTWSDGRVVYLCAFPGCAYQHAKARSVANHYGAAHTQKGETPPLPDTGRKSTPLTDHFEPTFHREYTPSQRLIDALALYLETHPDLEYGASKADLAKAMLQWAHERPDLPDVEHHVPAAQEPEDILERIRMLVGAPLASRLAEVEQALAEAEAGRQRAEERWAALKSIVDEA